MTGAFKTETTQMAQAAGRVDDVNAAVQSQLATLRSSVESVRASWRGQAAATFAALMARWNADAGALSHALGEIAAQLRAAGQGYAARDEAAQAAVRTAGAELRL
jgi:WXG100 family type VII secretion target